MKRKKYFGSTIRVLVAVVRNSRNGTGSHEREFGS